MTRELYKDDRIRISQAETPDEHDVEVGKNKNYCYLGRGILRELAEADSGRLRQSLEAMNPVFLYRIDTEKISLEQLGWALSKARISELKQEVQYFVKEYNELKAKTE